MEHARHTPYRHDDPMVIQLKKQPAPPAPPRATPPPLPLRPVRERKASRGWGLITAVAIVCIGVGLALGRGTGQHDAPALPSENVSAATQTQTPVEMHNATDVVAHIGKLILLPDGEQPTVATVSNLDPLKGQSFFAHARVGDVVLMYAKAKKAFLYDPKADQVIEVAPIITNPS
jgi:hypothetical protein